MALSAQTVWEVRYAGSDTNGGGFVSSASGTDYSKQNSANSGGSNSSTTDAVTAGTTTITSATAAFTSAIVGNIIYIAGGTGSITGAWYQVVTYTNSTTIVVDRSTGLTTGTGATMNIGGALGSPGQLGALLTVNGMIGWIKYTSGSPFLMNNATANTSGGPVSLTLAVVVQGYDQTRGDQTGNQPVLSWASVASPGTVTYIYAVTGSSPALVNLAVNGNSVNNVSGYTTNGAFGRFLWCTAENCNGTGALYGFNLGAPGAASAIGCNAVSCSTGFYEGSCALCYAGQCTTGFNSPNLCVDCVAYANTTGFRAGINGQMFLRCTADTNTNGFTSVTGTPCAFVDCIASNNTAAGISNSSAYLLTANFANYNTTNLTGQAIQQPLNPITLTAQPYMTPLSQFAPNATPGGGASLRGAATPVWRQTDDKDIGAVHSANQVGLTGLIMMVKGQTVAIH